MSEVIKEQYTVNQIIASEAALFEALKTSDVSALDNLLHEDLLFVIPGGIIITKQMDLEAYRSGNMRVLSVIANSQIIKMFGGTAVVSVTVELKGAYMGEPIDGKFSYLRVWKCQDNCWKIITGSCTVLPEN